MLVNVARYAFFHIIYVLQVLIGLYQLPDSFFESYSTYVCYYPITHLGFFTNLLNTSFSCPSHSHRFVPSSVAHTTFLSHHG